MDIGNFVIAADGRIGCIYRLLGNNQAMVAWPERYGAVFSKHCIDDLILIVPATQEEDDHADNNG